MSSIDPVHPRAKAGFQDADAYSSNRVQCTPECVKFILNLFALRAEGEPKPPNLAYDILELGAGTGKFTGVVQPYLHKNIGYLATEPSESFLRKLEQDHPGVHTKQCSASSIPLPDQSVNTVIAAQAFHWFASTESLTEIWRVLVRGGCLVLVWNERDGSADKWVQDVGNFLATLYSEQGVPHQRLRTWMKVFEGSDLFTKIEKETLPGPVNTGRQKITASFETLSVIQSTDAETRRRNMKEIISLLPAGELTLSTSIYCDEGLTVFSGTAITGSPRQQWNYWKKPFQNNDRFTDLMNKQFCGPVKTGRDEVTAFLETLSVIQSTNAETSKRNMKEMIGMFPAGEVALPFVSELYWCFRV